MIVFETPYDEYVVITETCVLPDGRPYYRHATYWNGEMQTPPGSSWTEQQAKEHHATLVDILMASMPQIRRVRERAYQIWEQAGHPHGQHKEHWYQAVKETGFGTHKTRKTRAHFT